MKEEQKRDSSPAVCEKICTYENKREEFQNPGVSYRGKPFWAWNGKLKREELIRQIDILEEMGFGGFFMHSRVGLETEYLGEEWFALTNACADYGEEKGMQAWLYDEDRWPSGTAGGLATMDEAYRASFLKMEAIGSGQFTPELWMENTVAVFTCIRNGCCYRNARRLAKGELPGAGETVLTFTVTPAQCREVYNGYTYLDTMNKEAVEHFIQLTHEAYAAHCGGRTGSKIRGIFTDEPHRGTVFSEFSGGCTYALPYTPALFAEFQKRFGYSLTDCLPDLFLLKEGQKLAKVKWDYMELCQQLFLENYAIPIHKWCGEHQMLFTGHVLHEDSLTAQTMMQGSLMRFYEYMDIPGVDVLFEDNRCWWIVKQAVSAARQMGKRQVLSELYGCSGWNVSLEGYKAMGNWQAFFGINFRCPHLCWYTMKGETKRDYPASIFYQASWYREYRAVEDYFSRIHVFLDHMEPECSLLVIYPIESVWARIYAGAFEGMAAADPDINRLELEFQELFYGLTGRGIEFDYGDEGLLAAHGCVEQKELVLGACRYRKILVAGMDTIRSSTVALLEEVQRNGGQVIFAGNAPDYVDAVPSARCAQLAAHSERVPWDMERIAAACADGGEVKVSAKDRDLGEILVRSFRSPRSAWSCRGQSTQSTWSCRDTQSTRSMWSTQCTQRTQSTCSSQNIRSNLQGSQSIQRPCVRAVMVLNTNKEKNFKNVKIQWDAVECMEADWSARDGKDYKSDCRKNEDCKQDTDCKPIVEFWDAADGHTETVEVQRDGQTESIVTDLAPNEMKLYLISQGSENQIASKTIHRGNSDSIRIQMPEQYDYRLSEQNICVLDRVTAQVLENGNAVFRTGPEDVLRADQKLRTYFGIPARGPEMLQPWFEARQRQKEKPLGRVRVQYEWEIRKLPESLEVVLEELCHVKQLRLNGKPVEQSSRGEWTDPCFSRILLPTRDLTAGRNSLMIEYDYYKGGGLEAVYLLGYFGVYLEEGYKPALDQLPEKIGIGDLTGQGFPFYSGGVSYLLPNPIPAGNRVRVEAHNWKGSCLKAVGETAVLIPWAPYTAETDGLSEVEVILNRKNTFGPLHQRQRHPLYCEPASFMTEGNDWSDHYVLEPQGLLEQPDIAVEMHNQQL